MARKLVDGMTPLCPKCCRFIKIKDGKFIPHPYGFTYGVKGECPMSGKAPK